MKYISTRDKSKNFEFKDVFLKGLADDGGLFIPESLHKYSESEIGDFKKIIRKNVIGSNESELVAMVQP